MKKRISFLTLAFMILFCITASAIPSPSENFYYEDFSGVLSEKTEKFIMDNSVALASKTGAQIVVVTVESLDGKDVMDYGLEILRSWGVGDNEKNNGIVVLLSTGDRKIGVNIGYGLEGVLPDSKVGRLIDICAIESLKENDFDTGIFNLYNALLSETYKEYNLSVPETVIPAEYYEEQSAKEERRQNIIAVILFLLILIYIIFSSKRSGRSGRFYSGGGFSGGGFSGGGGYSGGGGSGGGGGASRDF